MIGWSGASLIIAFVGYSEAFDFKAFRETGGFEISWDYRQTVSNSEFPCAEEGFFVHPVNCSRFYRCIDFTNQKVSFSRFLYTCPKNNIFAQKTLSCIPGDCLKKEVFPSARIGSADQPCTGGNQLYRHWKNYCNIFYKCEEENTIHLCNTGATFNTEAQTCQMTIKNDRRCVNKKILEISSKAIKDAFSSDDVGVFQHDFPPIRNALPLSFSKITNIKTVSEPEKIANTNTAINPTGDEQLKHLLRSFTASFQANMENSHVKQPEQQYFLSGTNFQHDFNFGVNPFFYNNIMNRRYNINSWQNTNDPDNVSAQNIYNELVKRFGETHTASENRPTFENKKLTDIEVTLNKLLNNFDIQPSNKNQNSQLQPNLDLPSFSNFPFRTAQINIPPNDIAAQNIYNELVKRFGETHTAAENRPTFENKKFADIEVTLNKLLNNFDIQPSNENQNSQLQTNLDLPSFSNSPFRSAQINIVPNDIAVQKLYNELVKRFSERQDTDSKIKPTSGDTKLPDVEATLNRILNHFDTLPSNFNQNSQLKPNLDLPSFSNSPFRSAQNINVESNANAAQKIFNELIKRFSEKQHDNSLIKPSSGDENLTNIGTTSSNPLNNFAQPSTTDQNMLLIQHNNSEMKHTSEDEKLINIDTTSSNVIDKFDIQHSNVDQNSQLPQHREFEIIPSPKDETITNVDELSSDAINNLDIQLSTVDQNSQLPQHRDSEVKPSSDDAKLTNGGTTTASSAINTFGTQQFNINQNSQLIPNLDLPSNLNIPVTSSGQNTNVPLMQFSEIKDNDHREETSYEIPFAFEMNFNNMDSIGAFNVPTINGLYNIPTNPFFVGETRIDVDK